MTETKEKKSADAKEKMMKRCEICPDFEYKTQRQLEAHVGRVHPNQAELKCPRKGKDGKDCKYVREMRYFRGESVLLSN